MPESEESFLRWIKRELESLDDLPAADQSMVVNLATSGVFAPSAGGWLERTCRDGLPAVLERMRATNEFGLRALKQAVRQRYRIPDDREVFLTAGASGGFRLVCGSLLAGKPNVEVLIESPTYQPLVRLPLRFGATLVPVHLPLSGSPGEVADAFCRAVQPSSEVLVLTNLHNPTGRFLSREDVGRIVRSAKAASPDITVVIDETFLDLGPEPFRTAADIDPSIVTINSLTKSVGMGPLRCGWVVAHKSRLPQLQEDWINFESIGSKILEALALVAFDQFDELLRESRQHLAANRSLLAAAAQTLRQEHLLAGEVPAFGCLSFLRWAGRPTADHVAQKLRDEFGLLVAPGRFFSDRSLDYLRLGFGGSTENLREGLDRLTRGLRSLV